MNNTARMMLEKKLMDHRSYRRDREDEYRKDYGDDNRDYGYHHDERRRYDRRDYEPERRYDYESDRRDYAMTSDNRSHDMRMDRNDYGHDMRNFKLTKEDIHEWSRDLDNKDGSRGPHFNMQQIINAAEKMGIHFDKYTEEEFCMTANMLYSDLCMDLRNVVTHDKEAIEYAKMARSWLEDSDTSAKYSEKLAIYYYCIVKK
jgi:hypothetical protein